MNFFSKLFSKKSASEQKLDTTKETLPNQKKVEIQVKKGTKPDISFLKCNGCKKEYEIGKNAVAVCLDSQAPGANILVVYDHDTERVDLVAPIDPSNIGAFERAKPGWKTIQDSLAHGQQRKWKCNLCNHVNSYPNIKFTLPKQDESNQSLPKQKDTESTSPKQNDIETSSFNQKNTFTDSRDGKTYKTVKIGNQVWMAENLNVSHFRNGDPIPEAKTADEWVRADEVARPSCCYYANNANVGKTYGKLYNWYAVNDPRGLAPEGWHVPSDGEWDELIGYLGCEDDAGGKLKETGATHWVSPNTGATNETGFTGLPGGDRSFIGSFSNFGYAGFWWSSTEYRTNRAWYRYLSYRGGDVYRDDFDKGFGFSVRCLRD